jgi:hypothetical protein
VSGEKIEAWNSAEERKMAIRRQDAGRVDRGEVIRRKKSYTVTSWVSAGNSLPSRDTQQASVNESFP